MSQLRMIRLWWSSLQHKGKGPINTHRHHDAWVLYPLFNLHCKDSHGAVISQQLPITKIIWPRFLQWPGSMHGFSGMYSVWMCFTPFQRVQTITVHGFLKEVRFCPHLINGKIYIRTMCNHFSWIVMEFLNWNEQWNIASLLLFSDLTLNIFGYFENKKNSTIAVTIHHEVALKRAS